MNETYENYESWCKVMTKFLFYNFELKRFSNKTKLPNCLLWDGSDWDAITAADSYILPWQHDTAFISVRIN